MENVKIKKLKENAVIPKKAFPYDAGWDLAACLDCDSISIPVGKTFNIGKMKKEVGQGDALLVTRFKSSKGKYTYNYKPTNSRVEFGFVKDSKTLVNSNGKKIKYSSKLTPGSYVQITYNTKLTYEHTDDTVKKVTVIGTYK